ncbi:MAG: radical SAM protein [bacterium]|nr:radical SAM protein [bacterium]
MKVIAALDADLDTTPLGTVSRLAEPLGDETVLRMTVRRLARAQRLQSIYVLVPPDQSARVTTLLEGTPAQVRQHETGSPPHTRLVSVARKWSLDGWRGGIGGAAAMDEYTHTRLLAGLAQQEQAGAVLCVPPAAALIDPELADAMIEYFCTAAEDMRMTFTLAPPGLSGTVFQTGLLQEMAEKNIPPGWTMSYKPDAPATDLTMRKCCFQAPEALRHSSGRMIADTGASLERIQRCLAEHAEPSAETVGRWLIAQARTYVPRLPREVEIELTTEDQLGATVLRPRGRRVGRRGPLDEEVVRRLGRELATYDDARVVLGGFGEPLLHPGLDRCLAGLRDAGVYGIALRTNGLALDDDNIETLIRHRVDVVSVSVDTANRDTYAALNGVDAQETVIGNLDRLVAAREGRPEAHPPRAPEVCPLVVAEMVKCRETLPEMEAFFDGWVRKLGWAVLTGYNDYGGRLEDRAVIDMTPPQRTACRRIQTRCLVTANADVLVCDQDFSVESTDGMAGSLLDATLEELWHGAAFRRVREAHAQGIPGTTHLCDRCCEWHRP